MNILSKHRFVVRRTTAAAALALMCSAASAGVVYEFEGTVGQPPNLQGGGFTYSANTFVTSTLTVPASALDECHVSSPSAQCNGVQFLPDFFAGYDAIGFSFLNTGYHLFYFVDGAFSKPGFYGPAIPDLSNRATLIVREVSTVPEPGPMALLLASLALIACTRALRRGAK